MTLWVLIMTERQSTCVIYGRVAMKFSNAYAAYPVCTPTRASIVSGKYPARVGVTNFIGGQTKGKLIEAPYTRYLPLEEHGLATALGDGGYQTWHVGKWHLGEEAYYPEQHGFDVNEGGCFWGLPAHGYWSSAGAVAGISTERPTRPQDCRYHSGPLFTPQSVYTPTRAAQGRESRQERRAEHVAQLPGLDSVDLDRLARHQPQCRSAAPRFPAVPRPMRPGIRSFGEAAQVLDQRMAAAGYW